MISDIKQKTNPKVEVKYGAKSQGVKPFCPEGQYPDIMSLERVNRENTERKAFNKYHIKNYQD